MRKSLFWLSDQQWKRIEPHLPTDVRGVERVDDRRVTEVIVAYVSKEGSFVVPSRIAVELFEQPGDSEASTPSLATEGQRAEEYVTRSDRPPGLGEPTDAFLERAKEMIQGAFKKEPS